MLRLLARSTISEDGSLFMRYSSGFGRHGARYVACRFENPPLLWEELGVVNVDEGFIGAALA